MFTANERYLSKFESYIRDTQKTYNNKDADCCFELIFFHAALTSGISHV